MQVGGGLSLFTNTSGRAILQKETNRYFFANNNTIAYINANTGVVEKSVELKLPNNLYGIYNLALDNSTNTIYGLTKQGPNGVNFYLVGINASTLQVTYAGNSSVSNILNIGFSAYNLVSKTYTFSVPDKIIEVSVQTGAIVKEHNLLANSTNDATKRYFDFYAFKTNIALAAQNSTALNVSIHPNPAIGTTGFNITIQQFTKPMECMILDSYGKVIHNFIMKQKTQKIEVGYLKRGTYFIKTDNETSRILIQ